MSDLSSLLPFNSSSPYRLFWKAPTTLPCMYQLPMFGGPIDMLILHRQQVGIAFSAAIVGALLSTAMSTALDISVPHWCTKNHDGTVPEEYRMLPAMVGGPLVTTALFWIAWTAKPTVHYLSPIFGTALYVWGAMSIIVSPFFPMLVGLWLTIGSRYPPSPICSTHTHHVAHCLHLQRQLHFDWSLPQSFLCS